jgi:hypothetical protein
VDHEPRSFVAFSRCVLELRPPFGKQRKSRRVQRLFPAGNGDLPAFLSLTGHLLQKPRGEAMNAETLLLCAGHR